MFFQSRGRRVDKPVTLLTDRVVDTVEENVEVGIPHRQLARKWHDRDADRDGLRRGVDQARVSSRPRAPTISRRSARLRLHRDQ